jgi:hypothetical protein
MNRNKEFLRAATDKLDERGIAYTVEQNKHFKIRWRCGGKSRTCILPVSSSDSRAKHHIKGFVRKTLREDGL